MGKINKYIEMIVNNGSQEDMDCLSDMFEDLMIRLKETNHNEYKKYKHKLYGMAYNYKFDEEMAHEIVGSMKPYGEYWDYDTTTSVKNKFGLMNINSCDFYIVMNSLVNDYGEIISGDDVETYVKMAKAFIEDEDAIKDKVWVYYNNIPKGE